VENKESKPKRLHKFRFIFLLGSLFVALIVLILNLMNSQIKQTVSTIRYGALGSDEAISYCREHYKKYASFEECRREFFKHIFLNKTNVTKEEND